MKIDLEIDGGLSATSLRGELSDFDDFDDFALKVSKAVDDGSLAACAVCPANPLRTDETSYHLTLQGFGIDEKSRHYSFKESQASDDILDLLDDLTAQLKNQLIAQRAKKAAQSINK